MVYAILQNSTLTLKTQTEVTRLWMDIADEGLHTGVDIACTEVYTAIPGTVLQINKNDSYSVLVQYDANHLINYCHLTSVCVHPGQMLSAAIKLGDVDKYAHIEYWVRHKTSQFPIGFGSETYYKVDPFPLLQQCKYE